MVLCSFISLIAIIHPSVLSPVAFLLAILRLLGYRLWGICARYSVLQSWDLFGQRAHRRRQLVRPPPLETFHLRQLRENVADELICVSFLLRNILEGPLFQESPFLAFIALL